MSSYADEPSQIGPMTRATAHGVSPMGRVLSRFINCCSFRRLSQIYKRFQPTAVSIYRKQFLLTCTKSESCQDAAKAMVSRRQSRRAGRREQDCIFQSVVCTDYCATATIRRELAPAHRSILRPFSNTRLPNVLE